MEKMVLQIKVRKSKRRVNIVVIFFTVICIIIALGFVGPFYWMIVAGTRSTADFFASPPKLLPGDKFIVNIKTLLEYVPFFRAYSNSIVVATLRVLLTLFFCSLAGFGFARYDFPGRDTLFIILLATMMIPATVMIVPWFILMSYLDWIDSFKALIIPEIAYAFGVFWMRQYISQAVSSELLDAARIDGCSEFIIYWRIVVPIILPAFGILALLTFITSWNDFMKPLIVLSTPDKYTLPLALASIRSSYMTQYAVMMAGAALNTVPVLVLFIIANKSFIAGLTWGGIKE